MKNVNLLGTILLGLALAGMTGCQHKPVATTQIPDLGPGSKPGSGDRGSQDQGGTLSTPAQPIGNQEPGAIDYGSYKALFDGPHTEDAEKFKQDTVYFDFDSATIKASEESKLTDIANYFKGNNRVEGLIIGGNCDERGTEKYNLSLGERRALAVREYLRNLQVDDHRLKTVTYGAMRPADPGHGESSWKQNRRDEFVLVTPK